MAPLSHPSRAIDAAIVFLILVGMGTMVAVQPKEILINHLFSRVSLPPIRVPLFLYCSK